MKYIVQTYFFLLTCKTHKTSGNDVWLGSTGPSNANIWWAGASDINCKSLGVF